MSQLSYFFNIDINASELSKRIKRNRQLFIENNIEYTFSRTGSKRTISLRNISGSGDDNDGLQVTSTRVTLNDLYNIWIKIKRGIKDNTFQNYKYMYETFVMEDIGKYHLVKIKKSNIRFFYNKLVDTKGFKIKTLDSIHTVLYQVLELVVDEESIRTNPASNALTELKRAHNISKKKKKTLTLEEQITFEKYLSENKITNRRKPIFTIMLNTRLRVGEITGLT